MRQLCKRTLWLWMLCLCTTACDDGQGTETNQPTEAELNAPLPDEVDTQKGPVLGTAQDGVRIFKGIPYATPPVGERRFQVPEEAAAWDRPYPAVRFSPGCMQSASPLSDDVSEDCLTINIWAPNRQAPKPVMIWIHGGGFTFWSSGFDLFDGARLAETADVVVVSLNYRLGVLGFLPIQDGVYEEKRILGLLDQQLAFKWVRDNIAAFGGDPNNVTLFGESAGGFSICYHLGMPSSDGLFHKAIIQSGGSCSPPKSAPSVAYVYDELMRLTECGAPDAGDSLTCLREMDAERLMSVQKELPQNAIGTSLLWPLRTETPLVEGGANRRSQGLAPKIPLIAGSNLEEFTFFTAIGGIAAGSDADFETALDLLGLDETTENRVREIYNVDNYGTIRKSIEAMGTDAVFTCPALRFATDTSTPDYPIYLYQFRMDLGPALAFAGATHGAEIPYVFDTGEAGLLGLPIEIDPAQAVKYQGLWRHFAYEGTPPTELMWPPFSSDNPSLMLMEPEWRLAQHDYEERCALLDVDIL